MADFWVVGPIAWDRVLHVPRLPPSGGFVQASEDSERPGGSGANTAIALASTGAAVHMVGYVGDDEPGSRLRAVLGTAGVDVRFVHGRRGQFDLQPSGGSLGVTEELAGKRREFGIEQKCGAQPVGNHSLEQFNPFAS